MSTNAKTGRKETHPVTGYERLHGKATVFDDLRFPLGAKNIDSNSTRYAQDLFNGGITVNANARFPNEPILCANQIPHSWKIGSIFYPHFHWIQRAIDASIPNWMLAYKIQNNGEAEVVESNYNNHTQVAWESNVFPYVSGDLAQITRFPAIDMSAYGLSSKLNFVMFRDVGNTSGLFAGGDPSVIIERIQEFDIHIEKDSWGSSQEYIKDSA